MKGNAIQNHVNGFFIKSPIFFKKFIIKSIGVIGVVSLYLSLHAFESSFNSEFLQQR
jgi:hypothetical protein